MLCGMFRGIWFHILKIKMLQIVHGDGDGDGDRDKDGRR